MGREQTEIKRRAFHPGLVKEGTFGGSTETALWFKRSRKGEGKHREFGKGVLVSRNSTETDDLDIPCFKDVADEMVRHLKYEINIIGGSWRRPLYPS